MVFIHPQDTPEVAIIVNKPAPPKILNEIKLQDTDLLVIGRSDVQKILSSFKNFIITPM